MKIVKKIIRKISNKKIDILIRFVILLIVLVIFGAIYYGVNTDIFKDTWIYQSIDERRQEREERGTKYENGVQLSVEIPNEYLEQAYYDQNVKYLNSFRVEIGANGIEEGTYEIDSQLAGPGCYAQILYRPKGSINDYVITLDNNNPSTSMTLEHGDTFSISYYCDDGSGNYVFDAEKEVKIKKVE